MLRLNDFSRASASRLVGNPLIIFFLLSPRQSLYLRLTYQVPLFSSL